MPGPDHVAGPQPPADRWYEPRRLAAWAPDEARERLIELGGDGPLDERELAGAATVLARIGAATAAWDLARGACAAAAAAWSSLDPARAAALEALGGLLPLAPLASDEEALDAELELVRRAVGHGRPPPLLARAVVELQRAQAPRAVTARLEASFGLAPEEFAVVMGAVASVLAPDEIPLLPFEGWVAALEDSLLEGPPAEARVLASGLVRATPALVPHPALVTRLLGRPGPDAPRGVRLRPLAPAGDAPEGAARLARALALGGGVALHVGPAGAGRRSAAAHVATRLGRRAVLAEPGFGAGAAGLAAAALEARLFDLLPVVDLDAWGAHGVAPSALLGLGPLVAVAREEPELPTDRLAYALRWAPLAVSSPG